MFPAVAALSLGLALMFFGVVERHPVTDPGGGELAGAELHPVYWPGMLMFFFGTIHLP